MKLQLTALATLILGAAPAQAAPVTTTYAFSASDFTPLTGIGSLPFPVLSGTLRFTLDTSVDARNATGDIEIAFDQNFSVQDLRYSLNRVVLVIGAQSFDTALARGLNDVQLFILNYSSAPLLTSFTYTADGDAGIYGASTLSLTPVTAPVSEPATTTISLVGLAGIALLRRRARG